MALPSPLSLNYDNSAVLQGLVEPDKDKFLYYLNGGKYKLNMILSRIAPSRRVMGRVGNIQKPLMGYPAVQATIASISFTNIPGGGAIINFTDPNYSNFRTTDVIMNNPSSNFQATVVATQQGQITVAGLGNNVITSSNYSTLFPVGSYVSTNWNAQGYNANSRTPLYETPFYVQNWTSKFRESTILNQDDYYQTWVGAAGKPIYVYDQEILMIDRAMRGLEVRAVWSNASGVDTNYLGGRSTNMGLVASIQDPQRGGVVVPYGSPITLQMLTQTLMQLKARYNDPVLSFIAICGSQFLVQFQNLIAPYVQAAGVRNTFGGEAVMGLDVKMYQIAGCHIGFIDLPAFDDPNILPNPTTIPGLSGTMASNSCIILDEGMYSEPTGGATRAAIERIHFGTQEYIYKYIPGVVSGGLADTPVLDGSIAVNGQDSFGVEFQTDSGIDAIGYRMAYIYPLN